MIPRVEIKFCTKCKWNFRATWYMQELLSTFGMDIGEIALIPTDGGVFQIKIYTERYSSDKAKLSEQDGQTDDNAILIWDRKTHGGFPDSKELKKLIRDVIQPGRDLGHVDRHTGGLVSKKTSEKATEKAVGAEETDREMDTGCSGPDCNVP